MAHGDDTSIGLRNGPPSAKYQQTGHKAPISTRLYDRVVSSDNVDVVWDRVTIIIPTYNRAHLVGKAISSVLGQDYPNVDVVVVDDGSTDDTRVVLASYKDEARVRVVWRSENGGVTAAKNSGIDSLEADVTYFGILDSDDVLEPRAISQLVKRFRDAQAPLSQVFGWCEDAHTGEPTGSMSVKDGLIQYEDALCGHFSGEFWQLVRKGSLGTLRFDPDAGGNEAMVWWPLLKVAPAALVDVIVRRYDRSGEDRVSRPTFTTQNAARMLRGYQSLLDRTGSDMRAACPTRYASLTLERAKWAALAGDRNEFSASLRSAWAAHPSWRVVKVGLLGSVPNRVLRWLYAQRFA